MEQYFTLSTHKIAYQLKEAPGKEKILFLHGLGASLTQFEREFSLLAKEYSVATLSLRGQGNSTRPIPHNPHDMTIAALASDVVQWMQAHSWKDVHIIGCSMGGVVALELLKHHSHVIKSLITFGTTPTLHFPLNVIRFGAWISDVLLPKLFPHWMAKMLPKSVTDIPEAQERFAQDLIIAYSQSKTIYQLRCELAQYDYRCVLRETTKEVLLLQGEKDSAINKEIEKLWPYLKENAHIHRTFLPNAGHIANYDQPEAFYRAITQFLKGEIV